MPRLTSLSGAQVAVLLHDPLGIVLFDEPADGVPQLRDVAVDAAMDDLFLQRAIEPLGDAVGLGLGDEGVGRLDAPELDLVGEAVRQFPVPVIARINGYCFGSGMEIAACADMRAAADHARFGMPEVRFGITSGMEASVLPRLIGWGKATELVLTGDHIDADEAYRIGFLERLVPAGELDAAVDRWIDSILACGPRAVRIQKRLIMDWDRMSATEGARAGIQAYVESYRTDEPKRMMTAFVNKKR